MERETIEVDVLIVGAGIAGLSCAWQFLQADHRQPGSEPPAVLIIEKGAYPGAHVLSGCILDMRALEELIPDWQTRGAPVGPRIESESFTYLSHRGATRLPGTLVPNYLLNQGHCLVHLGDLTAWLAEQVQAAGAEILDSTSAVEPILESGVLKGVLCHDTGVRKDGSHGPDYQPGACIRAKVTVLADGVRGNLSRRLLEREFFPPAARPQLFGLGLKELWDIPAGRMTAGQIQHTLGFPLHQRGGGLFGGGFIYAFSDTRIAIGLVLGLDYTDPTIDPHAEFQRWKRHSAIRSILDGGTLRMAGAKALPEGGWSAVPTLVAPGALMVGDAAGLLNPARLKGAHLAIVSGRIAGNTVAEAILEDNISAERLQTYEDGLRCSWAGEELRKFRAWRSAYSKGLIRGRAQDLLRAFGDPGDWIAPDLAPPDFAQLKPLKQAATPPKAVPIDGKLSLAKDASLFHSGTAHHEDQPSHLIVPDPDICRQWCAAEYGNPCQHFCPAGVYEWQPDEGLKIQAANCLHCKTCDIKDPYENIRWQPPEGGGGPKYKGM